MRTRSILCSALLLTSAAVGCGDDTDTGGGGTGGTGGDPTSSGGTGGGNTTTGGAGGNGGDVSTGGTGGEGGSKDPFMTPTPIAVPLSAAGPDQLQSVAATPDGGFVAAGWAAQTVSSARQVVVVKFSPTGPDLTFGTNGVAVTPLTFVGGADEIDVALQSDGKVIVSATVANQTNAMDRDVAVVRLESNGAIDPSFGGQGTGFVVVNLNDAHNDGSALIGMDAARGLAIDDDDNIYVHAASRAFGNATGGGPRTDTDFTILKLEPKGSVLQGFGENGQFRLDIQEANATPRGIKVVNGALIAGGYANTPDVDSVQPVLYKVSTDGEIVNGFATNGVFHEIVLTIQTEIYNFAVHGDNLVTAGYGRASGDANEYVSLRFNATTGVRDTTFGGATNGAVLIDPSGTKLGSNARNAIGLPDGSTIIIGSTGPANMTTQDAVFVVLDENGQLNTDYGDGIHVLPLGNNGNDQLWGGAVSNGYVALVGFQGGGQTQNETTNDDSYIVVFPAQ